MIIHHLDSKEFISFYSQSVLYSFLSLWLCTELMFFIVFHVVLIPRANRHVFPDGTVTSRNQSSSTFGQIYFQEKKTNPYRAPYHVHKHLLLRRILHRILMDTNTLIDNDATGPSLPRPTSDIPQDTMSCDPVVVQKVIVDFITSWFHPPYYVSESTKFRQTSSFVASNIIALPARVRLIKGYSTISSSSRDSSSSNSSNYSNSEDSGSDSGTEEATAKCVCRRSNGSDGSSKSASINRYWTIPNINKREMDDFLAWSMFNKHIQQMTVTDLAELQKCYQELQNIVGLTFYEEGNTFQSERQDSSLSSDTHSAPKLVPRRLSLEYAKAWHRPLLAYLVVYLLRTILTRLILQYCFGFVRVRSIAVPQLTGWYRPSKLSADQSRMPMVFFHGIAPAGVLLYLPMLLTGSQIVSDDRCCLLVDHYNISCTLQFDALSELETVVGVNELINAHFPNPSTTPIAVCGHSFGSCCISWLLNHSSKLRGQIQLCILLDPVSILLSDPHVMNNFLYSHKVLSCVRMVASSELFTEHYLRHHFSWYNSELWFDEVLLEEPPEGAMLGCENQNAVPRRQAPLHVLVALSEKDEIVNAPKVKRHIDLFVQRHYSKLSTTNRSNVLNPSSRLRTLYWKKARHASCVTDPKKWRDIQQAMYQCELDSVRSRERTIS
jgi:hypothetical protein